MTKVAMIGVGKLGQDCAEVMAEHYDVVGYDVEDRNPLNFPMKKSIEDAVKDRNIIFIAAPTPHSEEYGGETPTSHLPVKDFDYTILIDILKEVDKHTNKNQLVVLISTVLPGTTRRILKQYINNARFVYNPYLIAMGSVKWDMVNPEMIIIGTEDGSVTGDAKFLINFYKLFMKNNPRYEVGTWDEAESIKIFYNTFISTKLALVNMIQDVAESNGNINVDVVTNALAKSDYRITGPAYMKAGMGDAGACHPRDNIALRHLANRLDLGYDLFDSIMKAREVQAEKMAKTCLKYGNVVCIMGKAYKPGVAYLNGSYSLLVGHYIEKHNGKVLYYDLNTGDKHVDLKVPDVFLIGYWEKWVEGVFEKNNVPSNKIVIDPWRKLNNTLYEGTIIHYGNTRPDFNKLHEQKNLKLYTQNLWPEIKNRNDIYFVNAAPTLQTKNKHIICNDMIEAIKQGFKKIFFYNVSEGMSDWEFLRVEEILEQTKIDPSIIYYLTATENCEEVFSKLSNKLNLKYSKNINIVSLAAMQDSLLRFACQVEIPEYEIKLRSKNFLCFNKMMRLHRIMLIGKLFQNNLINDNYVSTYPTKLFDLHLSRGLEEVEKLDKNLYNTINQNKHLFPLVIDQYNDARENPIDFEQTDLEYYTNSYFSVVTETLFFSQISDPLNHAKEYNKSITFTEKTWKPIAVRHPFIMVGPSGMLKALKEKGYRTFSPYIDESYDDEDNDLKRLEMIVDEIKKLNNQTDTQWLNWQKNIKEIVDHNHALFFNTTDFKITKNIIL